MARVKRQLNLQKSKKKQKHNIYFHFPIEIDLLLQAFCLAPREIHIN